MKFEFNHLEKSVLDSLSKKGRVYLVGGIVRDMVMYQKVDYHDVDVEIYDLEIDEIIDILSQYGKVNEVGKSFGILKLDCLPNFDFALPRIERKKGQTHREFEVEVHKDLDMKTACCRRDFTINAMMYDYQNGKLIDYYQGREDIKNKCLKMVDEKTFYEDPLRVLRLAQFMSRFEFQVDLKTKEICQKMVNEGVKLYQENECDFLIGLGGGSPMDSAKAGLAQAKAQEVSARNNLSYTEVKSPSDGVIGTLPYRVGALVSAGLPQPLTTVSDNSDMYVYFSMTENQLLALTRQYGSKAEALKNMPEVELQLNDKSMYGEKGRIETISGIVDRTTGTASLRAVFPNKNGLLYSGTSGNVILPVTMKGSLVIPQATAFEIQDITYVYKVVDGKAQSAPVSVTRVNGGQEYIVNEGLKEGDIIVAEGVGLLREGTPIKVKQN